MELKQDFKGIYRISKDDYLRSGIETTKIIGLIKDAIRLHGSSTTYLRDELYGNSNCLIPKQDHNVFFLEDERDEEKLKLSCELLGCDRKDIEVYFDDLIIVINPREEEKMFDYRYYDGDWITPSDEEWEGFSDDYTVGEWLCDTLDEFMHQEYSTHDLNLQNFNILSSIETLYEYYEPLDECLDEYYDEIGEDEKAMEDEYYESLMNEGLMEDY